MTACYTGCMLLADLLDFVPSVLMFNSPAPQAAPAPLPPSPFIDEERRATQDKAARQALVDAAQGGRQSTVFAGRSIAMAEQAARSKKRAASDTLGL